jgi:hypothetical protein
VQLGGLFQDLGLDPRRRSASARVRPPTPAPMITTGGLPDMTAASRHSAASQAKSEQVIVLDAVRVSEQRSQVVGGGEVTAGKPVAAGSHGPALTASAALGSAAIRSPRRIFPDGDFGMLSVNSTSRTRLYGPTRSATQSISSCSRG